jgi:hypothetical protein
MKRRVVTFQDKWVSSDKEKAEYNLSK